MASSPLTALGAGPLDQTKPAGAAIGARVQHVGGIGGWAAFVEETEYVPELTFPMSILAFHRMRSDSQVDALHLGTVQPIREFRWSVDPNKCSPKLAERFASQLGLPMKGQEDEPLPRQAMDRPFSFDSFLEDALLTPLYGFFDFEIVGEDVEAKQWDLVDLMPLHPRNTADFKLDETGRLEGIRQRIANARGPGAGYMAGMPQPIPVSKLLHFTWRSEAGSPVGRSMLRSMYREWMVKDVVMRIAPINLQRAGGVPVIEGAPGMSDAQLQDLARLAMSFKVSESGGGAIPYGTKLNLVGGATADAISLLKYCDECMARVWSLMLIQLGVTSGANRALGGEFAIYAARAQRAMAKKIKEVFDTFGNRFVEWNDPFETYAPVLSFEPSKPEGMSVTDLVAMIDAGALTVDPELEEWLRAEYALPEKPPPPNDPTLGDLTPEEVALVQNARNPPALPPAGDMKPSVTQDPTSIDPTIARLYAGVPARAMRERTWRGIRAALTMPERKLHREPTENEVRAAVNFRALDSAHAMATKAVQDHYETSILPVQIKALGEQIRTTSKGDPRKSLSRATASKIEAPVVGQDVLHEALLSAARSGAITAHGEMLAQGVHTDAPTDDALTARISDQVSAVSELLANGISLAAQRKASSLISSEGRSPSEVATAVESYLTDLKHNWEREQLKGAVTMAQNQGRIAAFTQATGEEPTYESSELLDDRTCEPCEAVDGTAYESLADAEADYAAGGYVECEGGPSCRGTLLAVFPEQNPLSESNPVGGEVPEPALPM